jgi:hypothetical protein
MQNQTVKELLRLTEEIIELTGVGYADALAAALMDIEANTGLQTLKSDLDRWEL